MHTIPYLDIANANAYEQFIKCNQLIFKIMREDKIRTWSKQSRNNQWISSKAYDDFRFSYKFSLMVVGPSMCGKSYFVKQMLDGDHIEYDDPWKQRPIHCFMDNTKTCLKI